jgi:ATP-dependent Clp protease adaptor protein ClpS
MQSIRLRWQTDIAIGVEIFGAKGGVNQMKDFRMQVFSAVRSGGVDLPDVDVRDSVSTDLPWNVVVHNDPVNLMSYVTKVFVRVFGFSEERAKKHMLEVHHKGRSIVWSGARERAEFYVQQLHGYLLLSTIEKNS